MTTTRRGARPPSGRARVPPPSASGAPVVGERPRELLAGKGTAGASGRRRAGTRGGASALTSPSRCRRSPPCRRSLARNRPSSGRGMAPRVAPDQYDLVRVIVREQSAVTIPDAAWEFHRRTGRSVSPSAMGRDPVPALLRIRGHPVRHEARHGDQPRGRRGPRAVAGAVCGREIINELARTSFPGPTVAAAGVAVQVGLLRVAGVRAGDAPARRRRAIGSAGELRVGPGVAAGPGALRADGDREPASAEGVGRGHRGGRRSALGQVDARRSSQAGVGRISRHHIDHAEERGRTVHAADRALHHLDPLHRGERHQEVGAEAVLGLP